MQNLYGITGNYRAASLSEFFGVDKIEFSLQDPASFAHVIIDVQKMFCDPAFSHGQHMGKVAAKIASIKQKFSAAGANTIIVYYNDLGKTYEKAMGGPYLIENKPADILIRKDCDSAFLGSDIETILKERGIPNLFISGFNAGYCVKSTVLDGLARNFKIALLRDCIGQSGHFLPQDMQKCVTDHVNDMKIAGAYNTTSRQAVSFLSQLQDISPK